MHDTSASIRRVIHAGVHLTDAEAVVIGGPARGFVALFGLLLGTLLLLVVMVCL